MNQTLRCIAVLLGVFSASLAPFEAHARARAKAPTPKYSAIVLHPDSGEVLFNRYADQKRYPASLTKMMTLYLLFEELDAGRVSLDSEMSVSAQAAGQPPSKLGLTAGSKLAVEDAIKALIVKSANDAAVVVAEQISGSEWKFATLMTAKAREIGMPNTTFKNASGLPNSKQMTTARDLAVLSKRLIEDYPAYFHYFETRDFTWNGRTYRTHNSLVKTYDGADGLKTGYTQRSGFNLATTATRDHQRLVGVVLGGRSVRSRDAHMVEILDTAFASIKSKVYLTASNAAEDALTPRLKPTLLAANAARDNAPTIAGNSLMRNDISTAANEFNLQPGEATDGISALIASTERTDDLNEYERARLLIAQNTGEDAIGEGDFDDLSVWSVQIGAYSSKELAQQELEAAAIAAELTTRTRSVAPTTRDDGGFLYRARFTELSESEAALACEKIKSAALSCFVMAEPAAR